MLHYEYSTLLKHCQYYALDKKSVQRVDTMLSKAYTVIDVHERGDDMLYLHPEIRKTPNLSLRANPYDVKCIVVHATAGGEAGSVAWLTNKASNVSADVVIAKNGKVYLLNPEPWRYYTWHAGVSHWKGLEVNNRTLNPVSVGIELVNANDGKDPYTFEQYVMLSKVVRWYRETFNISAENVVRHLDVSPGRKTDPAGFQWELWKALACGELQ